MLGGLGLFGGRAFDGTVLPFLIGTAICAALALVAVVVTEPRRLLERLPRTSAAQ